MGMTLPVGEILAQFEFAADGQFVRSTARDRVPKLIQASVLRPAYDRVTAPVLSVFAVPSDPTTKLAVFNKAERARFRAALPSARVVELPVKHYLFVTDPEPVAREIRAFLGTL